jgi:hypothetical protein
MFVHAKPFWALLLTAVMVLSYAPSDLSLMDEFSDPQRVAPDRDAYRWNVTADYNSHSPPYTEHHDQNTTGNTLAVAAFVGDEHLNITVFLDDPGGNRWANAPSNIRVLIGLLSVPTYDANTNLTVMENKSGWMVDAIETNLLRPERNSQQTSLIVQSNDLVTKSCYLVHVRLGNATATDVQGTSNSSTQTFVFQPVFIEYDGGQCPLKDSDGDGFSDVQETEAGSNMNDPFSVPNLVDSDGDGVPDIHDTRNCTQTGWTSNPATDHDRDGCKDGGEFEEDFDDDNDGVLDVNDDCRVSPLAYMGGFSAHDHDEDGCMNFIEDVDSDDDGMCDWGAGHASCVAGPDVFPLDSAAKNDTDGDGLPDEISHSDTELMVDEDDDNDGWSDELEVDCSETLGQWDSKDWTSFPPDHDEDGYCDHMDDDDDNDGWNDGSDAFQFNNKEWNDADGDGVGDNSDDDADGDGWTNAQENQTGNTTSWLNNASSLDSDGDGWLDGTELLCGSDPKDPDQTPSDVDNDDVCDLMDDDADGDGWTNEQEGRPTDVTSWLDPDVTPDADGDTWTNVHENLTQAVFVNDHAWVEDHLPAWMVSAYIKGDWWSDGDITPDMAVSAILSELNQSINILNEEVVALEQQLNQSDGPCDEVCVIEDMDLDGWSDEEEIRFRENVSIWLDQYDLPYHEVIYQMELDAERTPAMVVHHLLDEIDDLQISMEALNMTLLTTLEGCLNTCPDLNQTNVTVNVADTEPGISDAGLVTSGILSGGLLTAGVVEFIRRWRLNSNTGRMKTAGKAFDVARGLRGRRTRGTVVHVTGAPAPAPEPVIEDDIVYGESDQYSARGVRRQRSLSEAGNLDGAMNYKE